MRDAACACVCVCGRRTSVRALARAFFPSPLVRLRLHAHVGGWLRWSRGGAAVGATARRRGCVGAAVLVSISQARRELEQLKRDRSIRHIPHPHPHLLLGTAHCRSPEGQHLAPRSAMPRGGVGGVSGGGGGPRHVLFFLMPVRWVAALLHWASVEKMCHRPSRPFVGRVGRQCAARQRRVVHVLVVARFGPVVVGS